VIFVAHAGLDELVSIADIWRSLPIRQVVRAQWWRVPAAEVPRAAGQEEQVRWLYDWWQRIDDWIDHSARDRTGRPRSAFPDSVLPFPAGHFRREFIAGG
jgi:hypothetical protein